MLGFKGKPRGNPPFWGGPPGLRVETEKPSLEPQAAEWPNSCNLNLYDTGGSSVAWHADDESLFNGKAQERSQRDPAGPNGFQLGSSRIFLLGAFFWGGIL